ncbi:polysaccharide biosynthesis C-terminal domain-containing protein [Pseudomonas stutzeri]|nr:polysaccharide biosynthesis C-terminal domain-containing protein [Stutzerimonas stutzeri]
MYKQVTIYLAGRIAPAAIGFMALLAYSHIVPSEEYGKYAAALAISNILNLSLHQWSRISLTRFYSGNNTGNGRYIAYTIAFFSAINLATTLLIIITAASGLINKETAAMIVAMVIASSWSDLTLEVLRAKSKPLNYSVHFLLRQTLIVSIAISLIYSDLSQHALSIGFTVGNIIPAILNTPKIIRDADWTKTNKSEVLAFVKYGTPLSINFSLSAIMNTADRLIVISILGPAAGGIYSLAADISKQIVMTVMEAINLAALPLAVKKLEAEGKDSAANQLNKNLSILLLISTPIVAGLFLCAEEISKSALGKDYEETASIIIPLIALATFLRGLRIYYFDQSFQLSKKTHKTIYATVFSAATLIAGCYTLTPAFGMTGAAYASIISFSAALFISRYLGCSEFEMPVPWKEIIKIFICASAMGVAVYAIPNYQQSFTTLAVKAITGALTYTFLAITLNICDAKETLKALLLNRQA